MQHISPQKFQNIADFIPLLAHAEPQTSPSVAKKKLTATTAAK
jgi:hypothetical protein